MENELGGEQSMACGPPIPILHYLNLIVREGNERIIIIIFNYQSRVVLQCCVNICCIAK